MAVPRSEAIGIRGLTRYRVQLQEQRTALMSMKHSKEAPHDVQAFILKSNRNLIKQIEAREKEVERLIDANEELSEG